MTPELPRDLLSRLPLRLYIVDEEHHAFSLDGRELASPGVVHGSDCLICGLSEDDCAIRQSLRDGRHRHIRLPPHMCGGERGLNLDILPLAGAMAGGVLVVERELDELDLELSRTDVGLERQLRQLDIMNQVLAALQQCRDLDPILRIILAGLTFGKGLEFNRAFYFERQGEEIVGRLAVGPLNGDEAAHIWARNDLTALSLAELFEKLDAPVDDLPIQRHVETLRFHLAAASPQLLQALDRPGCTCLHMPEIREPGALCLLDLTGSQESWLVPVRVPSSELRGQEEWRGFLLVDNAITNRPPTSEHLDALVSCARHLGFALERARMNRELDLRLQELQTAYAQLDRNQEQLLKAEKMAAVGRVTGNLAHEIKTPLMSIGGFARLLVRELAGMDKPLEHAELVLKESRRIERILESLMDYATPQILRRDRVDLGARARQLAERLEESFRERGIELALDLPEDPCWVFGDALRLDQLLHTQFQNVLDLNEPRRDNGPRCAHASLRLWIEDGVVTLSLADDGPGVSAPLVDTLFEPFVSGRDGALGLGLTQARDIARLHEGDIRLVQPGRLGGAEIITTLHGRNHGQDPVRG
jgi:signal transduction histidine kinase